MRKLAIFALLCAVFAAPGCLKHPDPYVPTFNNDDFFDFATTQECNVAVNYNLVPGFYQNPIGIEIYDQYPYQSEESRVLVDGLEPVLSAYADENGLFEGKVLLTSGQKKVWLRTSFFEPENTPDYDYGFIQNKPVVGMPTVVELPVVNGSISFVMSGIANLPDWSTMPGSDGTAVEASASLLKSVGLTRAGTTPGDIYQVTGTNWNNTTGLPSPVYKNTNIPASVTSAINTVLREGVDLTEYTTGLYGSLPGMIMNKNIHTLTLTFVHSDGIGLNSLAYYTYPDINNPPALKDVRLTMVLPNTNFSGQGGALQAGMSFQLWRWDGSKYVTDFPKGTILGFVYLPDAFQAGTGNIDDVPERYYSNYDWTTGRTGTESQGTGRQQIVSFTNSGNANCIFGVERDNVLGDSDKDFNDLVFFVETLPSGGGSPTNDVEILPPPLPYPPTVWTQYKGTLIYEDLWPNHGDFDMNDVVVEYTCKVETNQFNQVVSVQDYFVPVNNGASLQNGFAYQYGTVPSSRVTSMNFETNAIGLPNYSDPKNPAYKAIPWEKDAKGFETSQPYANILLFDDIRTPGLTDGSYWYRITTRFDSPDEPGYNGIKQADLGFPPYNPYIIILHGTSADPRNRELHLTSLPGLTYYPPTAKASYEWFARYDDWSVPQLNAFYVSNLDYPFAVIVPKHNFKLSPEMVNITLSYRDFVPWAQSKGANFQDWYDHPSF